MPLLSLLCQEIDVGGGVPGTGVGRLQEAPDVAGEVALDAADGFSSGFAFGAAAGDVVARSGWQRARVTMTRSSAALIWRLPQVSRRWRWVLPELAEIGATPEARARLAGVAKRCAPAISPTSLAAINGPKPGWASSCGAVSETSAAMSRSSWWIDCVRSRRRRRSSRAMRTSQDLPAAPWGRR